MSRDSVNTNDVLTVGLASASPARFPCPKCGRETSEHVGSPGTRICSQPKCRHVLQPQTTTLN